MENDFSSALPELAHLLQEKLKTLGRPTEPQKDAIRSMFTAVDATRMHLRRRPPGVYAPNPELIDLWNDAAIQVAVFDPDLAIRLRSKAEFWSDPENWDAEECEHAGIQLESLAKSARGLLQRIVPSPDRQAPSIPGNVHCFLSHASEDTETVAEPLAKAIETSGYRVWFDKFALTTGDSLRAQIDEGLRVSRHGVVVLSPSFLAKPWPMREVYAFLALEDADGRKRLIPVWHRVGIKEIALKSPLLADRIGVQTDLGLEEVARRIISQIAFAAA